MLEKSVEAYLVAEVAKRGGLCIKLNPKGYKGIPDRLVVLPGGWLMFAELKRPKGGVTAELQYWWLKKLWGLKHRAVLIDSKEGVDHALSSAPRVDEDDQRTR
jgi:hypothetical protein